jgi:hypothetical protein
VVGGCAADCCPATGAVWLRRKLQRKTALTRTSTQFADELLCSDCEQRFHRNSEDWVVRTCYRSKGKFGLRQMIAEIQPVSLNVAGLPFSPSQVQFIPTQMVPGLK